MIMEIPQRITCFISMKSEILYDHAASASGRRAPARTRPPTAPATAQ
jgi:hypothetical protein